jgi:hypothetical protein
MLGIFSYRPIVSWLLSLFDYGKSSEMDHFFVVSDRPFTPDIRCRRNRARRLSPEFAGIVKGTIMKIYNVSADQMLGPSRGVARVALARQVAMYLTHVIGRCDYAEVGRTFGRDRTTVQHACAVVEDRRDDPRFDMTLQLLEGIVEHLGAVSPENRETSH